MIRKTLILILLCTSTLNAESLSKCDWDNREGIQCLTISKTPNTSYLNSNSINKKTFSKKMILDSGAKSTIDLIKYVSGIDYYQNGPTGQTGAVFIRGSESNHTLVLLNGIPINDQSATNGIHDFGQDFLQTVQQVEVFKGSNGAHFGPDAIGGAVNFITDVDYENSYSFSGFNANNNSIDGNIAKITDNGWHINAKGAINQSVTDSAIAKGVESDGSKNYQLNLNANKWFSEKLKFKSVIYTRKTKSDYDKTKSAEESVTSDNNMYAIQAGLENKNKFSFNSLNFHYHNYDRDYRETGKIDTYNSESLVAKFESERKISNGLSFGYGGEYKYDWGNFSTTTFTSQTKGHVNNFGLYGNVGYSLNDNQLFSMHVRNDDHKQTGGNQTYKYSFIQKLADAKIRLTHSTGLKNPSLYELYGSSSFGHSGNTGINPEKSETNEIFGEYKFSENLVFNSTAYRTRIKDSIKSNSSWTAYENKTSDTTQEGLENELYYKFLNQKISLVSHFAKSRTETNGPNSRRPDLSYGLDYSGNLNLPDLGLLKFGLNYRYIGDHLDWTGSKNEFVKSVDLVNANMSKEFYGLDFLLNVSNLLNERYEKPATYSQDGRMARISFGRVF